MLGLAGAWQVNAQCDQQWWAEQFGGSDNESLTELKSDAQGNFLLTGEFQGTAQFGSYSVSSNGGEDLFVAKADAQGNILWATSAGGSYNESVIAMDVDASGNIYVVGEYSEGTTFSGQTLVSNQDESIYLAKYNAAGEFQWVKTLESDSYNMDKITVLASGNDVVVVGTSGSSAVTIDSDVLEGGSDSYYDSQQSKSVYDSYSSIYFAKFSTAGTLQSSKRMIEQVGADSYMYAWEELRDAAIDAAGNIYVVGRFYDQDLLFPNATLSSKGEDDIFLAKYDKDFNYQWVKQLGGSSYDYAHQIEVDANGNVYVTGQFQGAIDIAGQLLNAVNYEDAFLAKLNSQGSVLWAKAFSNGYYYSNSLKDFGFDASGNVLALSEGPAFGGDEGNGESQLGKLNGYNGDLIDFVDVSFPDQINMSSGRINLVGGFYSFSLGNSFFEAEGSSDLLLLSLSSFDDLKTLNFSQVRPSLCSVTEENGKNKIVWNKLTEPGVEYYNIYRENFGEYELIGTQSASGSNSFIDEDANPMRRAYEYKVSATNACDVESMQSSSHLTVHLSMYPGPDNRWSLLWNHYEAYGEYDDREVAYYRIYRGGDMNNLSVIDSLPSYLGDMNTYTDLNVPQGDLVYMVETVFLDPCDAGGSSQYSNRVAVDADNDGKITSVDNALGNSLNVWPNPSSGNFELEWSYDDMVDLHVMVSDLNGRAIMDVQGQLPTELDLSEEGKGIYLLTIETASGHKEYRKLVVQ